MRILQAMVPQRPATTTETLAMTETLELTQVKGVGVKKATQLKGLGTNNVDDLARTSAEGIANKLQIFSEITKK